MTEQLSGSSDAYGNRIGRELRALSDKAIQPYDPEAIAHAVAVGSHTRVGRRIELHLGWLRGTRALILAILILMLALLLAVGVGAIRQPAPQIPFKAGTIAFARDGDLYVAASDGIDPTKIADGQPSSNEITKFAFSPDRQYLAFVRNQRSRNGRGDLGHRVTGRRHHGSLHGTRQEGPNRKQCRLDVRVGAR